MRNKRYSTKQIERTLIEYKTLYSVCHSFLDEWNKAGKRVSESLKCRAGEILQQLKEIPGYTREIFDGGLNGIEKVLMDIAN